jgi:hypothetical protein
MSPTISACSGAIVADDIERCIHQRVFGRVRGLKVQVLDGHVVVQGDAPTYYVKQLALEAARQALRTLEVPLRIDIRVS